jgi:hypothetical protein
MLRLGRWPKAKDPRRPTPEEADALFAAVAAYQDLFDTH